jgi:hypothetical protein
MKNRCKDFGELSPAPGWGQRPRHASRDGVDTGKLQAVPHFTPEFLPRERAKLPVLALRGFYMSNW